MNMKAGTKKQEYLGKDFIARMQDCLFGSY
jgi:hypothetical protein